MTISIHALFAEGDLAVAALPPAPGNFYPRPLRRGRPIASGFMPGRMNFYPRPLRRGRLCRLHLFRLERGISIHALFAEGDTVFICASPAPISFLSTPSSQRATGSPGGGCAGEAHFYPRPLRRGRPIIRDMFHWYVHISIHALFAEGDRSYATCSTGMSIFLSTPSSQRATRGLQDFRELVLFLSTPSSQRATRSPARPTS